MSRRIGNPVTWGLAVLVALLTVGAGTATAQNVPNSWQLTAFGGGYFGGQIYEGQDGVVDVGTAPTYGARLGYNFNRAIGVEVGWSQAKPNLNLGSYYCCGTGNSGTIGTITVNTYEADVLFSYGSRKASGYFAVGLGATAADARAFVANGLAAVIVPADLDAVGELPDGAFATSSWASAYAQLRQCEMSGELLRSLGRGGEEAREAERQLERLGRAGAACVDRLREDPALRSAAIYMSGRLRGADGLLAVVDWSTSEGVRDSLLAAWRFGEPNLISRLYVAPWERDADPIPTYARWESLGEPRELGATGVVHTVRLTGEDGRSGAYEITCARQPDSTWRIQAVDPAAGAR